MRPYYEDAKSGITIYHGDCREIAPALGVFDVVMVDPWYGVDATRTRKSQKYGWVDYHFTHSTDEARTDPTLVQMLVAQGERAIVWGGNYFTDVLAPTAHWLVWDKGQTDFSLADVELAWCSWPGAARRKVWARGTMVREGRVHPNQKPVAIMAWSLGYTTGRILDPFTGSGAALVAAKNLNRPAVGIEIEECYCEIAARRLDQEVLDLGAA